MSLVPAPCHLACYPALSVHRPHEPVTQTCLAERTYTFTWLIAILIYYQREVIMSTSGYYMSSWLISLHFPVIPDKKLLYAVWDQKTWSPNKTRLIKQCHWILCTVCMLSYTMIGTAFNTLITIYSLINGYVSKVWWTGASRLAFNVETQWFIGRHNNHKKHFE